MGDVFWVEGTEDPAAAGDLTNCVVPAEAMDK